MRPLGSYFGTKKTIGYLRPGYFLMNIDMILRQYQSFLYASKNNVMMVV